MRRWLVFVVFAVACGGGKNTDGDGPDGGACAQDCGDQICSTTGECVDHGTCRSTDDCKPDTICSANLTCIPVGTCAADGDCGAGMKCDLASNMCVIGGCGGQLLDLTYVPPNLLLVLDRSCSMRTNLTGTQTSKWSAAVAALTSVLGTYSTDVRWGLTMFPDTTNNSCSQDAIPLPVANNNAAPISTLLDAALATTDPNYPDGPCVTNIDTGITQAATDPALADATHKSYVMLISDGAQAGCDLAGGDAGTETAIGNLFTMRDVATFVVGFGSGTDAAQLNTFAIAGGKPLAGATKYYQADTAAQLDQAFQSIAGLVVSCDYTVNPPPPDLAQTYVFYENTELVPRDPTHAAGWDYDPVTMTLTMYGSYCDRLKSKVVDDVDVVFGCPTPPIL